MSVTVSVCMWTYNQEEYIEQAIDSVLMQRDCNYELIIGNDGSTDRTGEICAAYQKRYPNRIRVINHPEHKGLIMITRDCMMAATGKYIAICDSDDWWTDEYKLKKQVDSQNMKGIGAKINQNAVSSPCMTPCSSLIQSRSLGLCERISLNWLGNAGQNLKPFYWR